MVNRITKAKNDPSKERKKKQELWSQFGGNAENVGDWVTPWLDKTSHSLAAGLEKTAPKIRRSLGEVGPKIADTIDHTAPKIRDYLGHTVPEFVKSKEKLAEDHLTHLSEKFNHRHKSPHKNKYSRRKEDKTTELVSALIAEFGVDKHRLKRQIKKLPKATARAAQQAKLDAKKLKQSRRGKGWLIVFSLLGVSASIVALRKFTRPTDEKDMDEECKWKTPDIEAS